MICELVTTTYWPGASEEAARVAASAGHSVGLLGYWLATDIGVQGRTVELWSQPRPTPDGPVPLDQAVLRLDCVVAPEAPERPGGIYELRSYRMRDGGMPGWLRIYQAVLPARRRYSQLTALLTNVAGEADRAVHIWAYPDLAARAAAREAALADPAWQAFLRESRGQRFVERQDIAILRAAAHSPLN